MRGIDIKEYSVLVGIDWADRKHVYAVKKAGEEKHKIATSEQSPKGIEDWVESLKKLANGQKIVVALEQSKGGLMFGLMKYEFLTIVPIHPTTVANYRATWKTSGAKDDPSDAVLILEMLETQSKKLSACNIEPDSVRMLQRLTEQRVKFLNDVKRIGNKITSTVKEYFPLVLELFPKITKDVVANFLIAYPNLTTLQSATDEELLKFFRTHRGQKIEDKIKLIRATKHLTTDKAVVDSNSLLVKHLSAQVKSLNQSIDDYEKQIEKIYSTIPESKIFDSLPSSGEISAPKLLAAIGTNRDKFDTADALCRYAGVAPVVEQSGNQRWVHWRFSCNRHTRQAFIDWTFLSIRSCFWAQQFYASQRSKGKSHNIAIRALAFKWIRIIFHLWKNNKTYSETTYLKALQKAGSHLVKAMNPNAKEIPLIA